MPLIAILAWCSIEFGDSEAAFAFVVEHGASGGLSAGRGRPRGGASMHGDEEGIEGCRCKMGSGLFCF